MDIETPSAPPRRKFVRSPDGRDEFNLAEFPLTLLSDKASESVRTIEWEDEIVDRATGLAVNRKVIVTGSDAYGLPTALDADVLFALIQLTKQVNNFTCRDVSFSRYELVRVLDWRDDGKSYRRVEESLNRWVGTSIYFSAWRDKESETWQSEKFHVLDNVTLLSAGRRRRLRAAGQAELACSSISWNKVVFRNLQAGYVCPVDLDVYFSLKRSVSKRIFRYLGKHFRLRQSEALSFDLRTFAFEKIGLSRSYKDAGQLKKELQPALDELEAAGFLAPLPREQRYTKVSRGEWQIHLGRGARSVGVAGAEVEPEGPAAVAPLPSAPTSASRPSTTPEPSTAERALIDRGVTPATAAALAAEHGDDAVARHVAVFDWLSGRNDRRVSKNPAGYLAESIRRGYAAPRGFNATPAPAATAKPKAAAPIEADATPAEADDAALWDHWEALAPLEQQALTNEALRDGDAGLVALYRRALRTSPSAAAGYLRALRAERLRAQVDVGAARPAAERPNPAGRGRRAARSTPEQA